MSRCGGGGQVCGGTSPAGGAGGRWRGPRADAAAHPSVPAMLDVLLPARHRDHIRQWSHDNQALLSGMGAIQRQSLGDCWLPCRAWGYHRFRMMLASCSSWTSLILCKAGVCNAAGCSVLAQDVFVYLLCCRHAVIEVAGMAINTHMLIFPVTCMLCTSTFMC